MVIKSTTILAVKRGSELAMGGDGQVTMGNNTILKQKAVKIRRLYQGNVLAGFAGSVADAFTLLERFEASLENHHGNLLRAAVSMAKEWRQDRVLRRLESLLIVGDREHLLVLSGTGEVVEPDDGIAAVGSGGPYALAAARALLKHTDMRAKSIVEEALAIAASICVYTNSFFTIETVSGAGE